MKKGKENMSSPPQESTSAAGINEEEEEDRWAVALYDFAGDESNNHILSVRAGDIVLVSPRRKKDWWPANFNGQFGFLPKGYLKLKPIDWSPEDLSNLSFRDEHGDASSSESDSDSDDVELELAVALYSFEATNDKQLSFEVGQEFYVCRSSKQDWWLAEIDDKAGLVPSNYIRFLDDDDDDENDSGSNMNTPSAEVDEEGGGYEDEDMEGEMDDDDYSDDDDSSIDPSKPSQLGSVAICQYDFIGREEGELSFAKGDFVWVNPVKGVEWWTAQNDRGVTGIVPCNYLKIIKINENNSMASPTPAAPFSSGSGRNIESRKNIVNLLFFRMLLANSGLPEESLNQVIEKSDIFVVQKYSDGQVIFSEEEMKNIGAIYIVVQGRISVTHANAHLCFVGQGQWFGESSVLSKSSYQTRTSYRANGAVTMLVLNRDGFDKISKQFPSVKDELLRIATFRQGKYLKKFSFCQELSECTLDVLAALLKYKLFAANEILFRAGDTSRDLYIITYGEGHVLEGNSYVKANDSFGEESLICGTSRTTTVAVTKGLGTLVLTASDLASLMEAIPEAETVFNAKGFVWEESADTLQKLPLFAGVPRHKLDDISGACKYKSFAQGETIIRSGDIDTEMYVILQGQVDVVIDEDLKKRLGPNEYFGEIAALYGEKRSASVVVKHGPCRCLLVDGGAFRTFLKDCPQIKRDIMERMSKRQRRGSLRNVSSGSDVNNKDLTDSPEAATTATSDAGSGADGPARVKRYKPTQHWITGTTESLAGINEGDDARDQESVDALTAWTQIGQVMSPCHIAYECWPVYILPSSRLDLVPPETTLFIKVIGLEEQMTESTVSATTRNTVAQVVQKAFLNAKKTGRVIDPAGSSFFALKVQARNDFLVYVDIPLGQYECIAQAVRASQNRISLALVDLRYPPSSNGSGVHALRFARRKLLSGNRNTSSLGNWKPNSTRSNRTLSVSSEGSMYSTSGSDDEASYFAEFENTNMQRLPGVPRLSPQEWSKLMIDVTGKAIAVKDTWEEVSRQNQESTSKIGWPFRTKVIGLQNTSKITDSSADTYCMKLELVCGGEVLDQTYTCKFKIVGFTARLNELVYFNTSIKSLPLTTRLCVTLYDCSKIATSSGNVSDSASVGSGVGLVKGSSIGGSASTGDLQMMLMMKTNVGAVLAGASVQLFTSRHVLRTGLQHLVLWPGKPGEHSLFCNNHPLEGNCVLLLEFDEFLQEVYHELPPPVDVTVSTSTSYPASSPSNVLQRNNKSHEKVVEKASDEKKKKSGGLRNILKWSGGGSSSSSSNNNSPTESTLDSSLARQQQLALKELPDKIVKILKGSPLYELNPQDKAIIWEHREQIVNLPDNDMGLGLVLRSCNWMDKAEQKAGLNLLGTVKCPSAFVCLSMLDCCHGDYRVREFAVKCLEKVSDAQLGQLLNQLTQVLKYEAHHESPLARFLLRRALGNPRVFGTKLFWSLRAEMHNKAFSQRFGLLLRVYLDNSSSGHLEDLSQQLDVQNLLKGVADDVCRKKFSSKVERLNFARNSLSKLGHKLPGAFQLPLDSKVALKGLDVQGCRVMNSKKKPLWLRFNSVDPKEGGGLQSLIMFKSGDDLRQDQMTLQMLSIMNQIWLGYGLDLRLTTYGCISTGDQVGFIELVTNSETTAGIQKKHGKFGALSARSLRDWLQDSNYNFNSVVDNFVHSCAGYCVATYVLGIGDRHSDNIMIKRDGRLFHIDFGHFLGHFKSKFGVKRERAPFVFTKEMAYVMGGKNEKPYRKFVKLCCRAYNILRHNGTSLINMFRLMIPAGMPELSSLDDINYMCEKLCLDKTENEASESFKREINNSLGDTYRRVDNLIHNIKTGN